MNKRHRVAPRLKSLLLVMFAIGFFLIGFFSISLPPVQAQSWQALPPYNTLWPLWSPALSPVDALTGIATPIVTSLARTTVLPSQPGLTWDPAWANPWLLYNTPAGLLFYDPLYGINTWPPTYLVDPVSGLPIPISLPIGYAALAPTDPVWLQNTLPTANSTYLVAYPSFAPPSPLPFPPTFLLALGGTAITSVPALPPAASSLLGAVAILGTAVI